MMNLIKLKGHFMDKKLLVIIPVYNEAKNIGKVIEGIRKALNEDADILAINDHSSDRSLEIIKNDGIFFSKNWKRLILIFFVYKKS